MRKACPFALLALLGLMGDPSGACAETDAFGDRVRAYLLAHPEVILEALDQIGQREAEAKVADALAGFPDFFDKVSDLGLGAPDAAVRVIEFFDYKCGPCKAMHPKLEAMVSEHPDLRIEMRQLPILSPASEQAARFALATREVAGAAAYGRVHEALWALRGPMNETSFAQIAGEEGLDFAAIAGAMDSAQITEAIAYNRDVAITLNVLGTPAFITPRALRFGQSGIDELAALWFSR